MFEHFGSWLKAVGWWWIAAVGVVPGTLSLAGVTWLDDVMSPRDFVVVSLFLFLYGSFRAYQKLARDLDTRTPQFMIRASVLPTSVASSLYLTDVYIVNRHESKSLNLRFSLRAGDEVASQPARRVTRRLSDGNTRIHNPKDVKPQENHEGFLAFKWPAVDDQTPFVVDGVELVVVDEQTRSFGEVAIPLPTSKEGFEYPPSP